MLLTSSSSALTGSSQGLRERKLRVTPQSANQTRKTPKPPRPELSARPHTPDHTPTVAERQISYTVSVCFSENTRMQKSPFRCGSKVDGTTRYSPGGSLKRELTSRRLMKVSDLAV